MSQFRRIEDAHEIERQDKHKSYANKQKRDKDIQDDMEGKMK